jgi:Cu+-exporting ATPase
MAEVLPGDKAAQVQRLQRGNAGEGKKWGGSAPAQRRSVGALSPWWATA